MMASRRKRLHPRDCPCCTDTVQFDEQVPVISRRAFSILSSLSEREAAIELVNKLWIAGYRIVPIPERLRRRILSLHGTVQLT